MVQTKINGQHHGQPWMAKMTRIPRMKSWTQLQKWNTKGKKPLQTVETVIRCFCSCNPRLKPWASQDSAVLKGQHITERRCSRSRKSLPFNQNHKNHINHHNQGSDKIQVAFQPKANEFYLPLQAPFRQKNIAEHTANSDFKDQSIWIFNKTTKNYQLQWIASGENEH